MNVSLRAYLRRASALPPHMVAAKAAGLLHRRCRVAWQRYLDRRRPTYLPEEQACSMAPLLSDLRPEHLPAGLEETLAPLVIRALDHRFDILGTGWQTVEPPQVPFDAEVTSANRPRAAALRRLLPEGYRPLDWHRDIRGGHRWNPLDHFTEVCFTAVPNADVKRPWELARLQHLPQMALACILGAAGRWPAAEAAACAAECRAQILDLLAAAPPRFGVLWACPMDVAIRGANIALTFDLLRSAGVDLDAPFVSAVATALREHGRHVLANLEWHDGPRTNHYLADLAGLAFCGAVLGDGEGDAWLAFVAQELGVEGQAQFLADGGCFEGSTLYHRLSADLVLFPLALLLGRRARWQAVPPQALRSLRVRPPIDGPRLPEAVLQRVAALVAFAAGIQRPDGRAPQIGDNDSGRLFKLQPPLESTAEGLREDLLDIGPTVAAGQALLGQAADAWADAAVVRALAGGRTVAAAAPASPLPDDAAALARIEAAIATQPEARQRTTVIRLPGLDPAALTAQAFPQFGLYVLRGPTAFIALRCVALDDGHEWGHTHDDNLHLEVWHDGRLVVTDPGSFVYTADLPTRERYRSAAAHFVPRSSEAAAVSIFAPFGVDHRASGRCHVFGPQSMAASLIAPEAHVWRVVQLEAGRLIVRDGCSAGRLVVTPDDVPDPVTVSEGYGRKTAHPVRSL